MTDPQNPSPYGGPPQGDPQFGQPPYGQPQYGQPPQPYPPQPYQPQQPPTQYGPPAYGQPQQPSPYGQDYAPYAQQGYGDPAYGGGYPPQGPPAAPPASAGKGKWVAPALGVIVALAVGGYFLFSSSSSSNNNAGGSPAGAVKALLEAGKTGNTAAANAVLCKADQTAHIVDSLATAGRITSYSIATTHQSGSHATIESTISTTQGVSNQHLTFPLLKEGGVWKVCFSSAGGGFLTPGPSSPASASTGSQSVAPPPSSASIPNLTNVCASFNDQPFPVATAYITAAEYGQPQIAAGCVWQNSVPASIASQLSGLSLSPDYNSATGAGPYVWTGAGGKKATVTVTKEPDGKYYVTKIEIS